MRTTTSLPVTACILALASCGLIGCPQSHFGWVYSVGSEVTAECISRSPAGGYFVIGYGRPASDSPTRQQAMALKLSEAGKKEWSRFFNGLGGGLGTASADGGVFLEGCGDSISTAQLRVAKRDGEGDSVWEVAYGDVGQTYLFPCAMVATGDGGCVIAGRRDGGSEELPFILKLTPQGSVVWERHMTREVGFLNGTKMVSVGDAGFAVSGYGRLGEGRLLRVDSEGNPLWWKQYDGYWEGRGCAVDCTADGGFVLAGSPWKSDNTCVPVIIRTDGDGNVLWTVDNVLSSSRSTYTATYYTAHDMLVDGAGRIVVVGEKRIEFYNGIEMQVTGSGFIMQLSSTGGLNWYRSLSTGPFDTQTVDRVALTASGDYITLGKKANGIQVIRVSTAGRVM